jgi:uncharacterized protein YbjT (DUF2867 family)
VLTILFKAIVYVAMAGIAVIVGYVFLMSGIFHSPESYFQTAQYRSVDADILVVGGTRGTGLEIVKQLLERGESVVVTVRPTSNTDALDALGVDTVIMDALDPQQVHDAVAAGRYAAIVSTLGTSSRDLPTRQNFVQGLVRGQTKMDPMKRPDFIGNRNLVDAARVAGIKRFVLVTVIGAGNSADGLPLLARRGHNEVIPLKTQAEDYLRDSGLDYTIIRPGGLGPRNLRFTGTAKLTEDPLSFSYIGRSDLGHLTVAALGDTAAIGKTFTAYDPSRRYFWKLFID